MIISFSALLIDNVLDVTGVHSPLLFPLSKGFLWMPLLGWYVGHESLTSNTKKLLYTIGLIAMAVNFVLLSYTSYLRGAIDPTFVGYQTPTCIISSVAVFLFFKDFDWNAFIPSKIINKNVIPILSGCTFGVYLTHGLVLRIVRHYNLNLDNQIIGFIFIYIISLGIVFAIKKIPLIKKIVP